MVKEYSFKCQKCGEQFKISGHWYNQFLMQPYLEFKFKIHMARKHGIFGLKSILKGALILTASAVLQIVFLPYFLIGILFY